MNRRAENTKKDIILPQADFNGNHTIKDISEKNLCNLDLGWSNQSKCKCRAGYIFVFGENNFVLRIRKQLQSFAKTL